MDTGNQREPFVNKVDEEDRNSNNSGEDENDYDMDEEDYDSGIKDDILRPASTRSKIVVNLREPDSKKRKQFGKDDKVIYDLDKYDKVRMQLLLPDQKLYKCYEETIRELQTKEHLQPRKRKMPWYKLAPLVIFECVILILLSYVFFLIIQLALFNLVIVGIVFVFIAKIF